VWIAESGAHRSLIGFDSGGASSAIIARRQDWPPRLVEVVYDRVVGTAEHDQQI